MRSRLARWLITALAAAALAETVGLLQLAGSFEAMTVDWRFLLRGPRPPCEQIILVLVDEETAAGLPHRSPLPRRHLAQTIEALHRAGAAFIGLDVFLADRSSDAEGDSLLAAAIRDAGNVVLVSAMEAQEAQSGDAGRIEQLPSPYFLEVALAHGYSDLPIGPLETIREARLRAFPGGRESRSLALVLYSRFADSRAVAAGGETGEAHDRPTTKQQQGQTGPVPIDSRGSPGATDKMATWFQKQTAPIPTDSSGRPAATDRIAASLRRPADPLPIDYSGPPGAAGREGSSFRTYPSGLVASGLLPVEWIIGKIALVGTGLDDAPDRFRTPFFSKRYNYQRAFGVEVHAEVLRTLLAGAPVRHLSGPTSLLLVLAAGLLVTALTVYQGATAGGITAAAALSGVWIGGFAAFIRLGALSPVIVPSVSVLGAYLLAVVSVALTEGRQKRQIRGLFEKYVEPSVVKEMLQQPETWELGGRQAVLTMLFSDIEGFTTLSEAMDPRDTVRLLNDYLDEMSQIVFRYGGTIDKFEGDLIMAFFGAPVPQPDHATKACLAALAMQEQLAKLRERWQNEGKPLLKARIGINTGLVVVGNMGSSFRFDYTVIGDPVNLASRLEGENKQYGTAIMIGEATYQAAADSIQVRYLDEITVKGKTVPVKVYELTGRKDEVRG